MIRFDPRSAVVFAAALASASACIGALTAGALWPAIAAAAEEQQCTSAEIARNLNNINVIAEQNRQEIDKVADTSDQLRQLSTTQRQLVSRFTL